MLLRESQESYCGKVEKAPMEDNNGAYHEEKITISASCELQFRAWLVRVNFVRSTEDTPQDCAFSQL